MADFEEQGEYKDSLVSVIIPAYKSEDTLFEAVQSVLLQNYPHIQLVVCDDGTENFSKDTLEQYIQSRTQSISWLVLHQPENIGTVRNLNAGLKHSDGEWVVLLAADDVLANTHTISTLVEQAQANYVDWIVPKTALYDPKSKESKDISPLSDIRAVIESDSIQELFRELCFDCCLPSSGTLYRRRLLLDLGGFDTEFRLVEDWPLFLTLIQKGVMPEISKETVVLRRGGGISNRDAGVNHAYQQDLIKIMQLKILPITPQLAEHDRHILLKKIQDKKAVFELRFSCPTLKDKLVWCLTHIGVIIRKLNRGSKQNG